MFSQRSEPRYFHVLQSAAGNWRGDALRKGSILCIAGMTPEVEALVGAGVLAEMPEADDPTVRAWLLALAAPVLQHVEATSFRAAPESPRHPPKVYLTRAQVCQRLGWSDDELRRAISGPLRFPEHARCQAKFNEQTGVWTRTDHEWVEEDIHNWLVARERERELYAAIAVPS